MTGHLVARKYLAPAEPSYWKWDSDGEAVEFNDGILLAFRAQLVEVLDPCKEEGLPPFGAVLLAVAASMHRPNSEDSRASNSVRDLCLAHQQSGRMVPDALFERVFNKISQFSETIQALDDRDLKQTALQMVFEGCPVEVGHTSAEAVVEILRAGPPPELVKGGPDRDAFDRFLLDLRTLDAGLEGVTPDAVRRRHTTGLEELPEPADIVTPEELPVHAAAMQLIDQLRADEQHEAFGRAAQQLHAAIRLPRRLGSPDDVPLNGLSDISNRGQLDRLLVSELAQDDLTLAIRVASNEALYLRREETHTRLPTRRHVLVDLGLMQWGVPRVLSAACALALHAMGDHQTELKCWCATHDGVEPVSIHHREGLEEVLGRLEVDLSPARAIEALTGLVRDEPPGELVVVLNDASLADPAVIQAMRAWCGISVHALAVERSGRVVLWGASSQGLRELNRTQIDTDTLVNAQTPKQRSLTDPSRAADLPAALRQERLPLRVSHQIKPESCWFSEAGGGRTYSITSDRRLTRWDNAQRGPVELSDFLPRRELLWHAPAAGETVDALIGCIGKKPDVTSVILDPDTGSVSLLPLEIPFEAGDRRVIGVCCHRGTLFAVTDTQAMAIDPASGELLARRGFKEGRRVVRMQGRCIQLSNRRWYGLAYNASRIPIFVTCASESLLDGETVVAAFNADGIDGFVNVTDYGRCLMPQQHQTSHAAMPLTGADMHVEKVQYSGDGRMFLMSGVNTGHGRRMHVLVDIAENDQPVVRRSSEFGFGSSALAPQTMGRCNPRSVRVRYQGVGIGPDHSGAVSLFLKSRKSWLRMQVQHDQVTLVDIGKKKPACDVAGFSPMASPPGTRYDLMQAKLGDRGRVVLDTRGMLHLQPSTPDLTEATLVIEGSLVSGWCSDGRVFGDDYYTTSPGGGDREEITGAQAYKTTLLPIILHLA